MVLPVIAPNCGVNTVEVVDTPTLLNFSIDAEEDYMPYNVVCRFLLITDFNSSLVVCAYFFASKTGT